MKQQVKSKFKWLTLKCVPFMFVLLTSCSIKDTSTTDNHNHSHDQTSQADALKVTDLMLTDSQIQLANIRTQKIQVASMSSFLTISARVSQNTDLSQVISSRASGRVDRLFMKETGRVVKEGEPLYEIYSESLLTLQQEFLVARNQVKEADSKNERYVSFEVAARKKLRLFGLTELQIDQLASTGKTQPRIIFLAPAAGIIQAIEVQEGQSVNEGTVLYRIENLNSLWIEAELFANEVASVKTGDRVKVQIEQYPEIETTVQFITPEFKQATQTWIIRTKISNPGNLKPGMAAQVQLNEIKKETLAIPVKAVIRSEAGTHVYVQTEKNTFQPRKVKTGLENFSEVEILEGLKEGEVVAVSGVYLIYSEYILKHGVNPMVVIN